jgi:hypothetical protein
VEHRHGTVELGLKRRVAGDGKVHLAEFCRITGGMITLSSRFI